MGIGSSRLLRLLAYAFVAVLAFGTPIARADIGLVSDAGDVVRPNADDVSAGVSSVPTSAPLAAPAAPTDPVGSSAAPVAAQSVAAGGLNQAAPVTASTPLVPPAGLVRRAHRVAARTLAHARRTGANRGVVTPVAGATPTIATRLNERPSSSGAPLEATVPAIVAAAPALPDVHHGPAIRLRALGEPAAFRSGTSRSLGPPSAKVHALPVSAGTIVGPRSVLRPASASVRLPDASKRVPAPRWPLTLAGDGAGMFTAAGAGSGVGGELVLLAAAAGFLLPSVALGRRNGLQLPLPRPQLHALELERPG